MSNDNEKNKPNNFGKKWSNDEETQLLKELKKKIDVKKIALLHDRTEGGIISRCKEIAYNMYIKNESMENIMKITKLDIETINKTIKIKNILLEKNKNNKNNKEIKNNIHNEITSIKNTIEEYKSRLEIQENVIFILKKEVKKLKKMINDK
jgi:hypothetical protein